MQKKILTALMAAVLAVAGAGGVAAAVRYTTSQGAAMVIAGTELNFGSGGDAGTSLSGVVTGDASQEIYLTDKETVKEILVKEGDKVKEGDILLTYDMAKSSIALEQAKLGKESLLLEQTVAKKNLETLKTMKPYAGEGDFPFLPVMPEEGGEETESYADAVFYGAGTMMDGEAVPFNSTEAGAGSKDNPYRFLCGSEVEITPEFFSFLETKGAVSFQLEYYAGNIVSGEPENRLTFLAEDFSAMKKKDISTNHLFINLLTGEIINSTLNRQAVPFQKGDGTAQRPVSYLLSTGKKMTGSFLAERAAEAAEKPYIQISLLDRSGETVNVLLFQTNGLSASLPGESWYTVLTEETTAGMLPGNSGSASPSTPETGGEMPSPTPGTGEVMPSPKPETGEVMPSPTPGTGEEKPSPEPETGKEPPSPEEETGKAAAQGADRTNTGETAVNMWRLPPAVDLLLYARYFAADGREWKMSDGLIASTVAAAPAGAAGSNVETADGSASGGGNGTGSLISPGAQYTKEEIASMRKENENRLKSLALDLREADLKITQMEKAVSEGTVRAKMDGVIKKVGDLQNMPLDGSPFLVLSGVRGVYVKGAVPESMLGKIHEGISLSVNAWESGTVCDAQIKDISDYPDTTGQFGGYADSADSYYPFTAYIAEGGENLRAQEYVDMTVYGGQEGEEMSPGGFYLFRAFVREEDGASYVLKRGEKGKLVRQTVETGAVSGEGVEILSGADEEDYFAFPYGKTAKEGQKTREGTIQELYEMS